MPMEQAVSVLKSMDCIGKTRERLLAALEEKADRKFDGNIWIAVEWLEEQGVNVSDAPRWPLDEKRAVGHSSRGGQGDRPAFHLRSRSSLK
jgi:hypothetical protein